MNLADELLGIKPHKTLTGRVINNDDPEPVRSEIPALHRVRHFVEKTDGPFSPLDVALEIGITRAVASQYLNRFFAKRGLIKRAGYVYVGPKAVRMHLWKRK